LYFLGPAIVFLGVSDCISWGQRLYFLGPVIVFLGASDCISWGQRLYFLGPVIVFLGVIHHHFTMQMAVHWSSKIVSVYYIAYTKNTLAAVDTIFELLSSTGTAYLNCCHQLVLLILTAVINWYCLF
jgi:hypothetical protein